MTTREGASLAFLLLIGGLALGYALGLQETRTRAERAGHVSRAALDTAECQLAAAQARLYYLCQTVARRETESPLSEECYMLLTAQEGIVYDR